MICMCVCVSLSLSLYIYIYTYIYILYDTLVADGRQENRESRIWALRPSHLGVEQNQGRPRMGAIWECDQAKNGSARAKKGWAEDLLAAKCQSAQRFGEHAMGRGEEVTARAPNPTCCTGSY